MAEPKKPPPDPRAVRDLAAAIFARLYSPDRGKTPDHQANEAIAAARAFARVWDEQQTEK